LPVGFLTKNRAAKEAKTIMAVFAHADDELNVSPAEMEDNKTFLKYSKRFC